MLTVLSLKLLGITPVISILSSFLTLFYYNKAVPLSQFWARFRFLDVLFLPFYLKNIY